MKNQFYLFPIGFSKKAFKQLQDQIDGYEIDVHLLEHVTSDNSAQINALIIENDKEDADIVENIDFYRQLFPGLPIIVLSNTAIKLEHIHTLKKPFNRTDLCLLLEKLDRKKIDQKQNSKDIRSVYSNQSSLMHYPIKHCFQDYLVKTWKLQKKVKRPVELRFLNKPVLVINDDKVSKLLSDQRMQQLCKLTIYDHSISTVLLTTSAKGLLGVDTTSFIAKVALWSSCGRIPEGVNLTDIVRLVEPERYISLPEIHEAQLIQKFWSINNFSLQETEHILQVSQAQLFSLFSVLYALNLIEVVHPASLSVNKSKDNKKSFRQSWLEKLFLKRTNFSIPFENI